MPQKTLFVLLYLGFKGQKLEKADINVIRHTYMHNFLFFSFCLSVHNFAADLEKVT